MSDEDFFLAGYDQVLKRPVSVRRFPRRILDNPESRQRYLAALRRWSGLSHPNILTIYDVQPELILTEGVSGMCLRDYLDLPHERRAFSRELQSMFIPALLKGLGYAHGHGVVHGLLSPESIFLFPDDTLRIWGFGTAFLEAGARLTETFRRQAEFYFSPEQTRGEKADHRTDIWSVGVLLYYMSSRRLPFKADLIPFLIQRILLDEPAIPPEWDEGDVSPALRQAIWRCLRKRPADRYQNIGELEAALFKLPAEVVILPAKEGLMHHTLANNYFRQGKFELARLEWGKAADIDPHTPAYVNNLGVACWRNGDIPRAMDLLERAGSHFNLGLLRLEQADYAGARDSLTKATVFDPKFSASYLLLGECLFAESKFRDAIEEFQKSFILNPQSSRCLAGLAMVYRQLGRLEEARFYEEKASESKGLSPDIEPLLQSPPGILSLDEDEPSH